MRNKKIIYSIFLLFVIVLISLSFTSAGFWDKLTGKAATNSTTANVTLSNTPPVVDSVTPIAAVNPTEANMVSVYFYFTATDSDGIDDLNNNSAVAQFNLSGETDRVDLNCGVVGALSSTRVNYSCNVSLWYWDGAGSWTVNATIADNSGVTANNMTTHLTYNSLTAIQMNPDAALTWASVAITATQTLADDNPIEINNTGNYDVSSGNVQVNASDLDGDTTAGEWIGASNFTAMGLNSCGGTTLVNYTTTGISFTILPGGNNTIDAKDDSSGQEQVYFCLESMVDSLSKQSYSTTSGFGAWIIGVV